MQAEYETKVDQLTQEISTLSIEASVVEKLFHNVPPSLTKQIQSFLKSTQGVLAGSFVARQFFPQDFNNIDIFIPFNAAKSDAFEDMLYDFGWKNAVDLKTNHLYFLGSKIVDVQFYRAQQILIHVVTLNSANQSVLMQDIRSTFDIDGCTIMFDGQRMILPLSSTVSDLMQGRWRILPAGIPRTLPRNDVFWKYFRHRVNKYSSRGICFVNLLEILETKN